MTHWVGGVEVILLEATICDALSARVSQAGVRSGRGEERAGCGEAEWGRSAANFAKDQREQVKLPYG